MHLVNENKRISKNTFKHIFNCRNILFNYLDKKEQDTIYFIDYSYWSAHHGFIPKGRIISKLITSNQEEITIESNLYSNFIEKIEHNKFSFCAEKTIISLIKANKIKELTNLSNSLSSNISHGGIIYISVIDFKNNKVIISDILKEFCIE
jgi:hypothetical protein